MDDRGVLAARAARGDRSVIPWRILVTGAAVLLAAIAPGRVGAQEAESPGGIEAPVDTTGLASGPFARMSMLYERTIFRVDVLRLALHFGPETAGELEEIVAGREYDDSLADRVADEAVRSRNALVRSRFLRDVSFDRLMDGFRESMGHALEAGFLSPQEHEELLPRIEAQYRPVRDRGVRRGDTMWYRIRGDTFRVVLQATDGSPLVDRTSQGSAHARALLGGYLAPDSDFRDDLVRSLFGDAWR